MTRSSGGGTTHPSENTAVAGSRRLLVVRWVFPAEQSTSLEGDVLFGRDVLATAPLPGHETSRRHAEAKRRGPLPTLRDLGSRNGTWWNGRNIRDQECVLGPGGVLRIGDWVGVVCEFDDDGVAQEFRELGDRWYGGAALARAIEPARRAAATNLPATIEGETGTGKEGMANAIHKWSGRDPFVPVNCAAIPVALAEAQLFGYVKGAFTGAHVKTPGLFHAANHGTIFLDEILELAADVQAKLLRVLQEGKVQRVGTTDVECIDVRVVCATQKPLDQAVKEGKFREDLYGRLEGLTVKLPPLRARQEDILSLFSRLIQDEIGRRPMAMDPKFVEALLLYPWPRNVRELAMLVRSLVAVHGDEPKLKRSMLPERMRTSLPEGSAGGTTAPPPNAARASTDDEPQFSRLVEALRENAGNVTRAADAIGITLGRANRLMHRFGFDPDSLRRHPLGRRT